MFSSNTTQVSSGGYQISRSLRFNSADSAYLNRTPASATNQKTWTWSGWVKRSALRANLSDPATLFNAGGNGFNARFSYANPDQLEFYNYSGAAFQLNLATTAVYRDVSAWYHIVFALDTTQATDTNRFKVYVNGTQVTAFSTATYPSQNSDMLVNGTSVHALGVLNGIGGYYSGYMTEINFIDGQALTPSSFGETNAQTGVWQPKAYSGSYGTNGFYLNFSDNSNTTAATLGKDYSGNGNNWTPNNFSVTAGAGNDSLVDSPTSYGTDTGVGGTVRGNYATLNGVFVPTSSGVTNPTLANGNLSFVGNASTDTSGRSTIGVTSGKWYCEVTVSYVSALQDGLGIAYTQSDSSRTLGVLYRASGDKCVNNTVTSYGTNYVAGSVIGIALDADANTVTFYNTNVSQGSISFTPTTAIYFSTYGTNASPAFAGDINFGQRPFAYTAPSGYKALCTQNLPTPTIGATTATQAGKYFNPVLYTGTGANLSVTGVGFQPDLTWVKVRSAAYSHGVNDAVRGAGATLVTNDTASEYAYSAYFTAFTSDGFNLGSGSSVFNFASQTYVAWNWKANGSGSTNTSGSITSTVSANTTAGFSVVKWTGSSSNSTVGHGLGVAPKFIITKPASEAIDWYCYHESLGRSAYILLNSTSAAGSYTDYWGSTAFTSSVFGVFAGGGGGNNRVGQTMIAYCFAEVAGYSKFGSYTGNGSSDGVFVYTGFRPKYIMFKGSSVVTNWSIFDTSRSPYNLSTQILGANISDAEFTTTDSQIDILSNGIKIRSTTTTSGINQSGASYIFAAFAESPFKYSLAR